MDCVLKFEELEKERVELSEELLRLEQHLIKALEKDPRTLNSR
jgi:hypothetical protein